MSRIYLAPTDSHLDADNRYHRVVLHVNTTLGKITTYSHVTSLAGCSVATVTSSPPFLFSFLINVQTAEIPYFVNSIYFSPHRPFVSYLYELSVMSDMTAHG